jgi:hypothetical protein
MKFTAEITRAARFDPERMVRIAEEVVNGYS